MPTLSLRWADESIDRGIDHPMRVPIRQITSSSQHSYGIYCEQVYASTDGRRVAFRRFSPADARGGEIWIADLRTWRVACVGPMSRSLAASTPLMDSVYYVRPQGESEHVLVRLNLRTLEADDVYAFSDCPLPTASTISPDERTFVSSTRVHDNVYALYKVDLARGTWEFFHEEKDIINTHIQFEPARGRMLLIQQNRGAVIRPDGSCEWSSGEEGCALYVVDIDGKNQQFLPVGGPHTGAVDGHQCWIGDTGKVLAAVHEPLEIGGQCIVTPGDAKATHVMPGFAFIHVSVSSDGRLVAADHGGSTYVYLASLDTGRVLPLHDGRSTRGHGHHKWEEPYITPDNRHIIFNSDRTGIAQLYAAEIPEHVKAYLQEDQGGRNHPPR